MDLFFFALRVIQVLTMIYNTPGVAVNVDYVVFYLAATSASSLVSFSSSQASSIPVPPFGNPSSTTHQFFPVDVCPTQLDAVFISATACVAGVDVDVEAQSTVIAFSNDSTSVMVLPNDVRIDEIGLIGLVEPSIPSLPANVCPPHATPSLSNAVTGICDLDEESSAISLDSLVFTASPATVFDASETVLIESPSPFLPIDQLENAEQSKARSGRLVPQGLPSEEVPEPAAARVQPAVQAAITATSISEEDSIASSRPIAATISDTASPTSSVVVVIISSAAAIIISLVAVSAYLLSCMNVRGVSIHALHAPILTVVDACSQSLHADWTARYDSLQRTCIAAQQTSALALARAEDASANAALEHVQYIKNARTELENTQKIVMAQKNTIAENSVMRQRENSEVSFDDSKE